ncbi:MAG: hypothetical protein LC799_25390 [Actinobacteria bacterium]|nr:hypothetical protein [Actinomycetota bacterium]
MAGGLAKVADDALDRAQQPGPPATFSEDDVIERAMASLEDSRGTWGRADALWHLCEALPGDLGVEPAEVLPLLEGLTDKLLERVQRLSAVAVSASSRSAKSSVAALQAAIRVQHLTQVAEPGGRSGWRAKQTPCTSGDSTVFGGGSSVPFDCKYIGRHCGDRRVGVE